jgi:hypothetical protein
MRVSYAQARICLGWDVANHQGNVRPRLGAGVNTDTAPEDQRHLHHNLASSNPHSYLKTKQRYDTATSRSLGAKVIVVELEVMDLHVLDVQRLVHRRTTYLSLLPSLAV